MESTMLEYVLTQLAANKGRWPEIAEGSGVPLRTLEKVARQETADSRYSTIQRLYDYFRSCPTVPPPDARRVANG